MGFGNIGRTTGNTTLVVDGTQISGPDVTLIAGENVTLTGDGVARTVTVDVAEQSSPAGVDPIGNQVFGG